MKTVLCFFFAAALGFAQAPDSVSGLTYLEDILSSTLHTHVVVKLGANGTYTTALSANAVNTSGVPHRFSANFPGAGRYTYVKTSPQAGILTFAPSSSRDGLAVSGSRTLSFSSASAGEVLVQSTGIGSFALSQGQSPLTNSSVRGSANSIKPLILGFVVTGQPRLVLLRGIGPTLELFGVPNAALDPRIELRNSENSGGGILPRQNDDWGQSSSIGAAEESFGGASAATIQRAATDVGAFALPAGSKDSAILCLLMPGAYTVQIRTASSTDAEVLGEVYIMP